MFSTSTAIINNEEFASSYMPVGINKNVTLKEVTVKKSPQGKDFLEIVFENSEGQTATMSVWKNEKGMYIKTDEDLQRRDNAQFGNMMQILNCFYPTVEDVTLNSFKEMIDWVSSKLNPMIATKKALTLKVIYDNKGYTKVSTNGIFVEPADTTESQIKLFKSDRLERPVKADEEKPTDPLAVNATQAESTPVTSGDTVDHGADTNALPF